jgi:formimidoylglutamate deiminase
MSDQGRTLWVPRAWLPDGWASNVLLRIGGDGCWREVTVGVAQAPSDALRLSGPLLPGLVNAHSHAFQRAFAGLTERPAGQANRDDFWSWRDRMYRVALRITPTQLRAIAAQLYIELLRGGYTEVCEFHYLQHDQGGRAYADPYTLSWALADAAAAAGVGLTLMPTLYERAGFAQPNLRDDQRRFSASAANIYAQAEAIAQARLPLLRAGLAIHSLRAAAPESIHVLRRLAHDFAGPIHIHVAEQTAEVDDCLAATGARPVEWLVREGLLDRRWQLVHATHALPSEIEGAARSGAGVVLCPSTEANLGDGLCDLRAWLSHDVPMAIGSDSHVGRDWREELRWLEYGQRLALRQRNVSADSSATATRLWARVQQGSAASAGLRAWGLVAGARADALMPDPDESTLLGIGPDYTLDALIFSSPNRPWSDVMVAGHWVVRDGQHSQAKRIASEFVAAMHELWSGAIDQ